eukprot:TRINITY_DN9757_c0_g1_i1.p1 TRINITY_DN9757_c0_g1~~TRINITY_DN9757_c0_g1_i1.p1  ORF type:complete len:222 (-),score=27.92 TRINITY_DN9757_c0_g1_i1:39-668(-)
MKTLFLFLFFGTIVSSQNCTQYFNCAGCIGSNCEWCPESQTCGGGTCGNGTMITTILECGCDFYSGISCYSCTRAECTWCPGTRVCYTDGGHCESELAHGSDCEDLGPSGAFSISIIIVTSLVCLSVPIAILVLVIWTYVKAMKKKEEHIVMVTIENRDPPPPPYEVASEDIIVTPSETNVKSSEPTIPLDPEPEIREEIIEERISMDD